MTVAESSANRESRADAPFVGIEVTRRCNLRCPHCFTASGGDAHPGPGTQELMSLLSELASAGVHSVAFSGGEPLLRKDLVDLVRSGKQAGLSDVGLVTNGYWATESTARALRAAGLGTVQVSLDGVDAHDHDSVRSCGLGDYYRALRAIRMFKDAGLTVCVATVIAPRNVQRAPELAMFCEALGVDALRYCTFVPRGRGMTPEVAAAFAVSPTALDRFIAFVRELNASPRARLAVSIDHAMGPWTHGGEFQCESGLGVAYITAEGDLYPCPALIGEPFRIGNVFDTPVGELLALPALSAVRSIRREQIEGPCSTCSNRSCSGGCRGSAYSTTGNVYGAPSYCNFLRTSCET